MWHRESKKREFVQRIVPLRTHIICYCRRLLWKEEHLDDVVQEVVTIAFEKYDQFEPESNFRAWIFAICTNVVYNVNRKSAKEQQWLVTGDERIYDVVSELQREYAYDELLREPEKVLAHVGDELRAALSALSTNERTIFLLKSIGELTCKEMAESLKMPIGTVMAYLSRARGKLRVHLSDYARQYGFLSNDVREETTDGM